MLYYAIDLNVYIIDEQQQYHICVAFILFLRSLNLNFELLCDPSFAENNFFCFYYMRNTKYMIKTKYVYIHGKFKFNLVPRRFVNMFYLYYRSTQSYEHVSVVSAFAILFYFILKTINVSYPITENCVAISCY